MKPCPAISRRLTVSRPPNPQSTEPYQPSNLQHVTRSQPQAAKGGVMPLSESDQRNFQMLALAFTNRDVALVECQVVETGQTIPVICAINHRPPARSDRDHPLRRTTERQSLPTRESAPRGWQWLCDSSGTSRRTELSASPTRPSRGSWQPDEPVSQRSTQQRHRGGKTRGRRRLRIRLHRRPRSQKKTRS